LSDNVSAAGSDSSFFDPPIEYYRASGGVQNYGIASGDISRDGIVMRKSKGMMLNPSTSTASVIISDFDKSFANRERQMTPEHTPLRIKQINSFVSDKGEFS